MNSGLSHKGRAWDSPIEPVFETTSGDFATPKELFQRGVPHSKLSRIPVGMRFLRRVHHEHTIEVDERGWAFCPVCNQVFNCDYKDGDRPVVQEVCVGYQRVKPTEDKPSGSYKQVRLRKLIKQCKD